MQIYSPDESAVNTRPMFPSAPKERKSPTSFLFAPFILLLLLLPSLNGLWFICLGALLPTLATGGLQVSSAAFG